MQIIKHIAEASDKINLVMLIAGLSIFAISGIALIIYRKKRGIHHDVDRFVTDEEFKAASEYRRTWLEQQEEENSKEDNE